MVRGVVLHSSISKSAIVGKYLREWRQDKRSRLCTLRMGQRQLHP